MKMVYKVIIMVSVVVILAAVWAHYVPESKGEISNPELNIGSVENYTLTKDTKVLQIGDFNARAGTGSEIFIIEDKDFGFVVSYIKKDSGIFIPLPVSIARPSPRTPSEVKSGVEIISNSPYKVYRVVSASKETVSYIVYADETIAPYIETFRMDYLLSLRST